ncbi:MIF4G domain containing protein [Acanthamoeba castellanii str. Neff]|uniref:MIF4G domain containing protein n=1 Tax=Acanthamoeba castellanii (strain ATCC 30010 / Neff) TaxID=1257118 RepID=L8GQI1_ACACF|nr:MIF4G domain containing protein [Acanthamoeba castellanii str. Neff]ELR15137.1 MIF4G domain containing protein [Acanthamoeba castellanii str. Neff]
MAGEFWERLNSGFPFYRYRNRYVHNKHVWQRPRKVEGNDKIFKEIKGILNKLTLEKFQPLSDQLIGLLGQVTDVSMLDQVINQIFDKALTEPQFSKMYAELCLKVQPACPEFEDNGKKQNFRRLLLNRCQKEFEKKTQLDEDADKLSPEDKELREAKAKTRMFGNIIFIGELFKLRMLTDKIMHGCVIVTLLPPIGQGQPSHEDLEALCKLMSTVGKQLDAKTRGKPDSPMEQYFRRLTEMAEDKNHPARIRFMLTDLIDMRRNGWVGVGADDTPKTLEEVHKSLAKEEAARAGRGPAPPAGTRGAVVARPAAAARSTPAAHAATGGAGTSNTKGSADGWEVVGGSKGARGGKSGRGGASAPTKGQPAGEWETVSNSAKGRGGGGGSGGGRGGRGSSRGTDAPSARGGGRGAYASQRGGGRGATPTDRSRKGKEAVEALPVNPFSLLSAESEGKEKAESVDNKKGARPAGEVYVPSHRRRQQGEDKEAKKATEAVAPAKAPALSEEKIKQLDNDAEMLLEEYILSYDELEAGECIKELKAPEYHYKVVSKAVAKAIERKEEQRKLISKLLFQLHTEQNILSAESIAQGFADVLQAIEEVDVDSPKASSYLGNLIGQAVLDEILPLSFLNSGLDHLIASGKALKIASEAFRIIADRTNPEEMGIMCKESGLDFMRFLSEENRNLDYLSKYLREQVNVDMGLLVPSS